MAGERGPKAIETRAKKGGKKRGSEITSPYTMNAEREREREMTVCVCVLTFEC